ncbi:MAG: DMT family transporter [Rhizobiales bacterium]|nr:DMT family transporter [Hyphomicrobiales bacterium]MBI3674781.1 DMT family transporter [Hyphomicrobiales bacterium]
MIYRTGLGIACALAAASLYGLVPNVVRGALANGVPPVESTFFRTSLIATVFAILAIARGERIVVPREAMTSFIGQATSTLIISVGYLASVQFIPVGLAVIIFFTFPVIIMLAAPLVEGHPPGVLRTLIAVFAFAGLATAVGPSFKQLDLRGILLAAAAALFCTLQFFSGRSISKHMTPTVFGSLIHLAIWPATLAIALVAGGGHLRILPGGGVTVAGYAFMVAVGVLYIFSYLVHMLSLRYAPASAVAPFFNLEPMVATAVAALFLGERMAANQYAGGIMVLAAIVASSLVGFRRAVPA